MFSYSTRFCLSLLLQSVTIYHFYQVPKMLPHQLFKSGRGIFHPNIVRFECSWLLLLLLVGFQKIRSTKVYCCPQQVINRCLDGPILHETAFHSLRNIITFKILISHDTRSCHTPCYYSNLAHCPREEQRQLRN